MGTCTVSIKKRDAGIGDHVEVTADVTLSSSYATGGDTLTLSSLGLKTLRSIQGVGHSPVAAGMRPIGVVYPTSEAADVKLMVGVAATGVEETSTTSLTTHTIRIVAKGDHAYA